MALRLPLFPVDNFEISFESNYEEISNQLRDALVSSSAVPSRLLFGDSSSGLSGASGIDARSIARLMGHTASTGRFNEKWLPFVATVRFLVGFGRIDAVSIAMQLRDRYPRCTLSVLHDLVLRFGFSHDQAHYYIPELESLNAVIGNRVKRGIGNQSCKYNAHSLYLRCAVNPVGTCDGCEFFEEEAIASTKVNPNHQIAD